MMLGERWVEVAEVRVVGWVRGGGVVWNSNAEVLTRMPKKKIDTTSTLKTRTLRGENIDIHVNFAEGVCKIFVLGMTRTPPVW